MLIISWKKTPAILGGLALAAAVLISLPLLGQEEPAAPETQAVSDLGLAGAKGAAALAALKTAPASCEPLLEKASETGEPNLARRYRARAILAYRSTEGSPWKKEVHRLLHTAAWELGRDAPAFLKEEKIAARETLAGEKDDVIPELLSVYPENDYRRYQVARDILKTRGDAVVPGAKKLLGQPLFLTRLRAVHLLGMIGTEEALEAIGACADDRNSYVRKLVYEVWVKFGGPWAEKALAGLKDPSADIRAKVVRGFAKTSRFDLVGPRLLDPSFVVRKAAAAVLAGGGPKALPFLLPHALNEPSGPGRLEAVYGLGLFLYHQEENQPKDKEKLSAWEEATLTATVALGRLLRHDDWAVRGAAVEGLGSVNRLDLLEPFMKKETHPFVLHGKNFLRGLARGVPPDKRRVKTAKSDLPAVEGPDAIDWLPGDLAALDDGLKALRMSVKDLEFDRNIARDAYRFPFVQTALDKPLEIAALARKTTQKIRAARKYPGCLLGVITFPMAEALPPSEKKKEAWEKEAWNPMDLIASLGGTDLPDDLKEGLAAFFRGAQKGWLPGFDRALRHLTSADRELILTHVSELGWDPKLLPVWDRVDRAALVVAVEDFALDVHRLTQAVAESPAVKDQGILWIGETPFGPVRVTGSGADVHKAPSFLLIDLGGDDVYEGRASGGALGTAAKNAFSVVIDRAGNDRHNAAIPVAQGAGYLGLGAFVDLAGKDLYKGEVHAQGCGWFGAGMLTDYSGDDRFETDRVCQGASGFGFGVLADWAGDDVYYSRAYAQGFAFVQGVALLAEGGGNDLYYTDGKYLQYESMPHRKLSMCQGVGYGMRPHASGGIGLLWEGGGDDVYRGNAYAQGTSYWYALGMLVDEEGYDNYSAKIYSQASGIHMGVGVLCDLRGHDNYHSWGLSQSGSHDLGVSYFLDGRGDDIYTCHSASLGGAINHAVALFVDRHGRDAYLMKDNTAIGAGDLKGRQDWGSIGIFLDLGGFEDTYTSQKGGNGGFWTDGNFGVGIDR